MLYDLFISVVALTGQHTIVLGKLYLFLDKLLFRRVSRPTVIAPHTRAICQIDRLHRESCAYILLREKLYRLIDMNLLVN